MRVERTYLVLVTQVYEGDPPPEGWSTDSRDPLEPETDWPVEFLYGEDDQYVCDNWKLVTDYNSLLDDDQLSTRVLSKEVK